MGTSPSSLASVRDPVAHAPRLVALATLAGPACLAALALGFRLPSASTWLRFAVLLVAVTVAGLQSAPWQVARRNDGFEGLLIDVSDVFVIGAVFVLPGLLAALIGAGSFALMWAKDRLPAYKVAYNASMYAACGSAAWVLFHALDGRGDARWLAAAAAGAAAFLVLNMLGAVLARYVMRGIAVRGWRDVSVDYPWLEESLCASCGVLMAALWRTAPVFEILALVPLTTLYRVLWFREVQTASRSDAKTGLFNAEYFMRTAERELVRARRADYPLSVILADLDDLRSINNSRGHLAGDAAILVAARALRAHVREVDLPCRFGGEEFAVLLPHAGPEEALAIAERLRQEVERTAAEDPRTGERFAVTLSLGVASLTGEDFALQGLIQRADDALYEAKREGRNRIRPARAAEVAQRWGYPSASATRESTTSR